MALPGSSPPADLASARLTLTIWPLRQVRRVTEGIEAELLLPLHTFDFFASVCCFVYCMADKKDNKVNSQTPTGEKEQGSRFTYTLNTWPFIS